MILFHQLIDEITVESPNVGSGGEGTEPVQRQVGHTTAVQETPAAPDTYTNERIHSSVLLREVVRGREDWHAAIRGITKGQTRLGD